MTHPLLIALVVAGALWAPRTVAADPPTGPPSSAGADVADARVNINTAGIAELVVLPGIGPTRARAIVEVRQRRPFRRPEDILRVPGIGRKTFGRIRHAIRVE